MICRSSFLPLYIPGKGCMTMNLFEAVKDAIPTRMAAEHYGIEVKRGGMACCPFHNDRTPSMKVDKRFHCFGCQEDGNVIDFVEKLFDLSPKRAAEKFAEDFGVRYEGLQTWQPQKRLLLPFFDIPFWGPVPIQMLPESFELAVSSAEVLRL